MNIPDCTPREEIANSITHGIGVLLAIAALVILTTFSALHGDAWHVVSCIVFGITLLVCYTSSTLYHSIPLPRARDVFQALDHSSIFLLIAGTYTPFMLVSLRGPWGWSLFGVVWGLALLGIALRLIFKGRHHGLMVALYILMGWLVVIAAKPMIESLAPGGLLLLVGGGLAYTVGVVFYRWHHLPYNHAIWHGFVLAGSALHFFAVLFYVIPWPQAQVATA